MQKISKVYNALTHWHDFRLKLFAEGILIGSVAGIIVVLFRYFLEQAEVLRTHVYAYLQAAVWPITVLWFVFLLGIAYILSWIVKIEPMAAGSGIPQVKGAIMGMMKMNWFRVVISKFIGGILAIGAGLSLGREGPSIQLGATVGQGVSRMLGRTKIEERYLLTSGASAGLAAAFNAPLAGVIFSLEELHKNFSPAVLMSTIASAMTATVLTRHFFGLNPVFNFIGLPVLPTRYYGFLALLGIITGLLGVAFNWMLLKTLDIYEKQHFLTGMRKPALPLVVAGIAGFILPDILGGGNNLVGVIASHQFSLSILSILLIAKFFFTMLSYGSGVPGGIFLPMLVIGALVGGVYNDIITSLLGLDQDYSTTIIVLSMAAYFSAIVKAPITGSILIMEMTGSFNHMLSLIVVSMTAYLVADIVKSEPIYEKLLERSVVKERKSSKYITSDKRIVIEVVVCIGSKMDNRQIKNVDWPFQCLLVSIKRGDKELVPNGDTRIIAGDYLYILANEESASDIRILAGECKL